MKTITYPLYTLRLEEILNFIRVGDYERASKILNALHKLKENGKFQSLIDILNDFSDENTEIFIMYYSQKYMWIKSSKKLNNLVSIYGPKHHKTFVAYKPVTSVQFFAKRSYWGVFDIESFQLNISATGIRFIPFIVSWSIEGNDVGTIRICDHADFKPFVNHLIWNYKR